MIEIVNTYKSYINIILYNVHLCLINYSKINLFNYINVIFMAKKDNKISMPMSGAGLVRYFDDESVGPKIAPEIVIAITVILGIFCFILRFSV